METKDAMAYGINANNFDQSIIRTIEILSHAYSYSVMYSECYKTDDYNYYVIVSFERSHYSGKIDTIVSKFSWNALYDGKLYWHTLHSEDHYNDFSYESKMQIINSIRIK
jgi:hypothetical protein